MEIPWPQLAGAIAGGMVGGFAGFVTNNIQQRLHARLTRSNVASALCGEIVALSNRIESEYLTVLQAELTMLTDEHRYPNHRFSGQRDYAHVYRSLGQQIGYLPNELVRELVAWYISLTVFQERARELHELALRKDPELLGYAIEVALRQHADFSELVRLASPLVAALSKF